MAYLISESEHKILNDLIQFIYTSDSLRKIRREVIDKLQLIIPFSMADFCMGTTTSTGIPRLVDPITVSKSGERFERKFEQLYESKYYNFDYINWIYLTPESVVYRESDLLNSEIRERSPFYQEYLKSFDFSYAAGISIAKNGIFMGLLSLYNSERAGDFTDKDMAVLELLKPHLENKFFMELGKNTIAEKNRFSFLTYSYSLTNREIEIIGFLLYGFSYKEIGEILELSINTVKKHIANIFSKLDVHSRPQLIRFIVVSNLVSLWDADDYDKYLDN